MRRPLAIGFVLLLSATLLLGKRKKTEEELTQALPLPKELPLAVGASVERLVFHVSPLVGKGRLSAQCREALHAVLQSAHGASIVHLRAFVAGSGDVRRVQTIVSEVFTEKKLGLPTLSLVQVGALPLEGAQVLFEATAVDGRRIHNPHGLGFFSGQPSKLKDAVGPLKAAVVAAKVDPGAVQQVTCFLSSLDSQVDVRQQAERAFPAAALSLVQLQRSPLEDLANCEGIAALGQKPSGAVQFIDPVAEKASKAALVAPGAIAFTGSQMSFKNDAADVRLAFDHLGKALAADGFELKNAFAVHAYPLTRSSAERLRQVEFELIDAKNPPVLTMLLFEGLSSVDATAAVDLVAAK